MTPPEQPESDGPDRDPAESGASDVESQADHQPTEADATYGGSEKGESSATNDSPSEASSSATSAEASSTSAEASSADSAEASSFSDSAEASSSSDAAEEQVTGSEEAGQQDTAEPATPKRKRRGVLIGVVAALVVLGGGAGLFFAFSGGASAESVAEEYVALSDREAQHPKDVSTEDYRPLICEQAMPQIEQLQQAKQKFLQNANPQQLEQLKKIKTNVKDVQENGDSAQATFESNAPGQKPQESKLNLVKEQGDWKLCTG